jgi:hypothetical protein
MQEKKRRRKKEKRILEDKYGVANESITFKTHKANKKKTTKIVF